MKRIIAVVAVVLLVCSPPSWGFKTVSTLPSGDIIADIIGQVQEDQLREHICQLQSREGGEYCNEQGSRWSCDGPAIDRALDYAQQYFENLGLKTQLDPYSLGCRPGLSHNIEAELPGTESSQLVLLVAHLDSYVTGVSTASPAPGADDDASGSAAVFEAARILSQYKFKHTIRFVLFTGEEQWMVGSSAHAKKLASAGAQILGVFNMDMIGYDGDDNGLFEMWVRPGESEGLADLIVKTIETYSIALVPDVLADPRRGGDHESFWRRGYPALMIIEDTEFGETEDFNPCYHTLCDVLRMLNLSYAKRIAQAVIGAAAQLAEPIQ